MSMRNGFTEVPLCIKARAPRNFNKSRRSGSLMKSPPISLQRLYANDVSIVINVPDCYRVCGIVDPGPAIMRVRFGHFVFDPSLRPWIETQEAPRMKGARPHFTVFVGHCFVKCDVRDRRIILRYSPGLRIELDEHSAPAAKPCVSIQVEASASRSGNRSARIQFPHFTRLRVEQSKNSGSGLTAGPVTPVRAHGVVVSAVDPLERE